MLAVAQQTQDPELLIEAHLWIGVSVFFVGEVTETLRHAEHALSLYDAPQHRSLGFRFGQDPGVFSHFYKALALWFLGSPDQAEEEVRQARALAHELSHPASLVLALGDTAWFHQFRQEVQPTREWAETGLTCAMDYGHPYFIALGLLLHGWALVLQGQGEEGLAQMQQGLVGFQAIGAKNSRSQWLGMLAQAYGATGQVAEGLSVIAEALAHVRAQGEHLYEAELYRLQGELLLAQGPDHQPEGESAFQHALTVARQQDAKSWELRAATSLARLWQQQGKQVEAHELLAPVYNWFTEGFDTPDLKDAKMLLDTLT